VGREHGHINLTHKPDGLDPPLLTVTGGAVEHFTKVVKRRFARNVVPMKHQTLDGSSFDERIWTFEVRAHDGYRTILENGACGTDGLSLYVMIFIPQHEGYLVQRS
jgi:hypothetical protein